MSTNNNSSNGLSFTSLLQLVFIILKLCNVIHWSWFWVLSPTLLGVAILIAFLIFLLIAYIHKDK